MSMQKFLKLALGLSLLLFNLVPLQPGLAKQPFAPTSLTNSSPGDIGWKAGFSNNGTNSPIRAIAIEGKNVYVGGDFTTAGNSPANNIAMWDGIKWHSLGEGVDNEVYALVVDGRGNLFAGGYFKNAGGKPANGIARWNGKEWEALGNGIPLGYVFAITLDFTGNVYVGGMFTTAGDIEAHGIARWDGSSWHALRSGMFDLNPKSGWVRTLAIDRFGFLYAGGIFTTDSGGPANYLARWDGNEWSALGEGISGELYLTSVNALATDPRGNLYVGGLFTTAGGVNAENIAKWNGESWSSVGGIQSSEDIKAGVSSIVVDGGLIYVGGSLTTAGGIPLSGIAKWNGTTWENLGGGVRIERSNPFVSAMAIDRDGRLFAVGNFSQAGEVNANYIGVWNGIEWNALGSDHSVDAAIGVMVSDHSGGMYVGGAFTTAAGKEVNHIAHWDGTIWIDLDGGLSGGTYGPSVRALVLDKDGNLYAGGEFTQAGNIAAQNIARWAGDHWEALGSGVNGLVYCLAVDSQNNLYAGGHFLAAGDVPVNYVAKWNGSTWEALGSGLDSGPRALAVDTEDRLIVGGFIHTAGGIPVFNLARWNGNSWEAMTDRFVDPPNAFLVKGDTIYWIGSAAWKIHDGIVERVGDRLEGDDFAKVSFNTLAIDRNDRLLIGGFGFPLQDINSTTGILRRWNGNSWEPLGSGTNGIVNSLVYDDFGTLDVGGAFSIAGGKVSLYFAQWNEPFYQWLPFVDN